MDLLTEAANLFVERYKQQVLEGVRLSPGLDLPNKRLPQAKNISRATKNPFTHPKKRIDEVLFTGNTK